MSRSPVRGADDAPGPATAPATAVPAPRISEEQWQQRVTDYATVRGWLHVHFRPARTTRGWRTPVSGPLGQGFPDLLLLRGDRLVLMELKSARGRVTPAQRAVLAAFEAIPGATVLVARPADWDRVQQVLA